MTENPDNALFKYTLSTIEHAVAELKHVLPPEISNRVDWATLTLESGSYVDEELKQCESDLFSGAAATGAQGFPDARPLGAASLYFRRRRDVEPRRTPDCDIRGDSSSGDRCHDGFGNVESERSCLRRGSHCRKAFGEEVRPTCRRPARQGENRPTHGAGTRATMRPMLSTGEFVTVNGVRLYVRRVRGRGPAIVMIHGLTDNGACWGRVAAQLTPRFDIVAVDLRAHGLSDAPESGYAVSDHARDVIGVIEVLELSATTLIGHSLGADTAMEMAHLRPDLVTRLVIEDPPWSDDWVRSAPEERQKAREDWLRGLEQLKSLSLAQV